MGRRKTSLGAGGTHGGLRPRSNFAVCSFSVSGFCWSILLFVLFLCPGFVGLIILQFAIFLCPDFVGLFCCFFFCDCKLREQAFRCMVRSSCVTESEA